MMDLAKIFKERTKEGERDIRLYKRCNFIYLYNKLNTKRLGKYDSMLVRKEFRNLLLQLDRINMNVWKIVRLRRMVTEWDDSIKRQLYNIVFNLLIDCKDIYDRLLNIISMEKPVWQNVIINILATYKLSKDDVYEIMPYTDFENLKLLIRQIMRPVINLLTDIENGLLNGEIDDNKLKELENVMLISVLPYFENVYKNVIKLQEEVIW